MLDKLTAIVTIYSVPIHYAHVLLLVCRFIGKKILILMIKLQVHHSAGKFSHAITPMPTQKPLCAVKHNYWP